MAESPERPVDRRPDPLLADWLEALGHAGAFERPPAAAMLSPLAAAVNYFQPLLKDPDRDVRIRAITSLGNLGGQAHWALRQLHAALKETALKDPDESVRTLAVH